MIFMTKSSGCIGTKSAIEMFRKEITPPPHFSEFFLKIHPFLRAEASLSVRRKIKIPTPMSSQNLKDAIDHLKRSITPLTATTAPPTAAAAASTGAPTTTAAPITAPTATPFATSPAEFPEPPSCDKV